MEDGSKSKRRRLQKKRQKFLELIARHEVFEVIQRLENLCEGDNYDHEFFERNKICALYLSGCGGAKVITPACIIQVSVRLSLTSDMLKIGFGTTEFSAPASFGGQGCTNELELPINNRVVPVSAIGILGTGTSAAY